MRVGIVAVIALAVVLAACGDTAAPAAPVAEAAPTATEAPAPPTATDTPAPPPAPTPQPTATPHPPTAPARPTAVDFSLPSAQGPQYTLSSFAGQQPVVVVFYRAFW